MRSKTINIGQDDNRDENFRYTMEPLAIKDEGRGNGVKTIITNMSTVAFDLKVPPDYPTKYFSFVLGARTEFKENIGMVVYCRHTAASLTKVLNDFVREVVVCPKCKLPCESEFEVGGDKMDKMKRHCKACGDTRTMKTSRMVEHMIKKLSKKLERSRRNTNRNSRRQNV